MTIFQTTTTANTEPTTIVTDLHETSVSTTIVTTSDKSKMVLDLTTFHGNSDNTHEITIEAVTTVKTTTSFKSTAILNSSTIVNSTTLDYSSVTSNYDSTAMIYNTTPIESIVELPEIQQAELIHSNILTGLLVLLCLIVFMQCAYCVLKYKRTGSSQPVLRDYFMSQPDTESDIEMVEECNRGLNTSAELAVIIDRSSFRPRRIIINRPASSDNDTDIELGILTLINLD